MSLRRRWAFRCAATLIVLLVAEGALQTAFHLVPRFGARLLAPWDPRGSQSQPHPSLISVGNPYWSEHDAWGFRNPRVLTRADVVTLGDAQTYGTAALAHQSWPAQLSQQTGLTVYNMALGGYCAVQALELLDRALEREPQTILFGFYFGNDLYDAYNAVYLHGAFPEFRDSDLVANFARLQRDNSIEEDVIRIINGARRNSHSVFEPDRAGPLRQWVSAHLMLYAAARAARDVFNHVPSRAVAGLVDEDAAWLARCDAALQTPNTRIIYQSDSSRTILTPAHRARVLDTDDPRIAEGLRLCFRALKHLHSRCSARGVRFAVVLIPTRESVFSPLIPPADRIPALDQLLSRELTVRERLTTFLRESGIPTIDVLPPLRAAARAYPPIYPASENGNPNAAGYAVIANAAGYAVTAVDATGAAGAESAEFAVLPATP